MSHGILEPLTTYLTCKIEKSDGDHEVLDIKGVPVKGIPMIKLVHRTCGKIHEDTRRYQEYHRTKESVTVTRSLRRSGGSRQDRFGTTVVYEEPKSQVRALGRKLKTKSLK